MDFVRLGVAYSTNYIPDKLISGYTSLIWTERYDELGEFELKSYDIGGTLANLPVDTLVSHLETKEVMIVETHAVQTEGEGADEIPYITVKGRSALMILLHRLVESTYQKKRRMRKKYTPVDALCVLLWHAIDNTSSPGVDVTRGDTDPDTPNVVNDYPWSTLDDIPNVGVAEVIGAEGTTRWFNLEAGALWPQFQKIMQSADYGIRLVRPVSPNPCTIITVSTPLATRGNLIETATTDFAGLRFELYKGTDRTGTVKFSQLQGHLEKPTYLQSKQEYKSRLRNQTDVTSVPDVYRAGESGFSGWQRRSMSFDVGSPELPPEPDRPEMYKKDATETEKDNYYDDLAQFKVDLGKWKAKRTAIWADFREEVAISSLRELKKNRKVNMFDGDISLLNPYQYKRDYNLGDTVQLVDDYGRTTNMVVQEYIRTEDTDGDRGFPGLVEP